MLSFTLLGEVSLYKNGVPLSHFRSQKEVALLIYLAQTGQTHSREFIADLLWDGRSTQQALSNLRTTLTRLRKQVDEALVVTRKSLALAPEHREQIDAVHLLNILLEFGPVDTAEKAAPLQKALGAYQGHFLADFYLPDAPRFDAWVTTTRDHIHQQVRAAYEKLGQYARAANELDQGVSITRRWLEVDALNETAHTLLIQLLVENDQAHEAKVHYKYCADLFHRELDIAPPAAMTDLLIDARPTPTLVIEQPTPINRHNLPAPHNQFFGRTVVQQEIDARLDQSWCRLVTIVGEGGVGKTRLATTIARSRLDKYRDGIWLVELAPIDTDDADVAEAIAVEIATVLDLRLSGSKKPIEQLLTHLQHKQMLIILDNAEHLLEATVQLVQDIFRHSETVQLLVTSREALRLQAEWVISLTGLEYPTDETNETSFDAVDLFAARQAQQRRGGISADELTAMGQICRLVEGLPLAIELAAGLTRQTTAQEIAAELEGNFATLTTSLRDVPQRHRNLKLVFDMSWQTLTPSLQQRLAQLAVFRGGFTEAAARQITGTKTQQLVTLSDKSLLSYDSTINRYKLHAVVRAFAAEHRAATDQTPQKHTHYYLTLLAQHTEALQTSAPQAVMVEIEADMANIRQAWQTGLAECKVDLLLNALTSLSIYHQLRGLAHEAEGVMYTTLRTARIWEAKGLVLAIRSGLERSRFQIRLGRYRPAIQTLKVVLPLAVQVADQGAEGMGHVLWGEALWRLGEYDASDGKLNHALTIAHDFDDSLLLGWSHHHLGIINDIQSNYVTALNHLQQACAAWRAIDNLQALSGSLNSIGVVTYHQGDLPAAQQSWEEALSLCAKLDNHHQQSTLLNNLSIIATEQGDFLSAHHYLQLGLELVTISGNLISQGEIYVNLGRNYRLLGKTDLAVESLEQGLEISELIGSHSSMAMALYHLAETSKTQADTKQAEALYNQALKIAQEDNLKHTECDVLIGLAELLSRGNDSSRAKEYSTQAMALAKAIQNPIFLERATAVERYLSVSVDEEV